MRFSSTEFASYELERFFLSIDGYETSGSGFYSVANDASASMSRTVDTFNARADFPMGAPLGNFVPRIAQFSLSSEDTSIFNGVAPPTVAQINALEDFFNPGSVNFLGFEDSERNPRTVRFVLDSIEVRELVDDDVAPIPEPSAGLPFLSGLGVAGIRKSA